MFKVEEHESLLRPVPRTCCACTRFKVFVGVVLLTLTVAIGISATLITLLVFNKTSTYGAVTSSSKYATAAGLRVLRKGGNAVDAFATVQFVLGLTEPESSGIGGGLMAMYWSQKDQRMYALDGREEAPESLQGAPTAARGGESTGTPGTLRAVARLLKEHGTYTLAQAMAPAIELARDGYALERTVAERLATYASQLKDYPSTAALYLNADNSSKVAGTIMKNPDYANTLELIAKEGVDTFYTGAIAVDIVNTVKTTPPVMGRAGSLELSDLANYLPVYREPLKTSFLEFDIYGFPPPSSGGISVALALNIIEPYVDHLRALGYEDAETIKKVYDTLSLVFADRDQYTADPDWYDVPVAGLLNKAYAATRRVLLNNTFCLDMVSAGKPAGAPNSTQSGPPLKPESMLTTHFAIVDRDRNVISCTSTIEATWGNQMVVPGRGFLLNNELTDFSSAGPNNATGGRRTRRTALPPDNVSSGGKRPRSSMSPTIVFKDGHPHAATGSPGGPTIIGTVFDVLLRLLALNMTPLDAVSTPRYVTTNQHVWLMEPELLDLPSLADGLRSLGCLVSEQNGYKSGAANTIVLRDLLDSNGAILKREITPVADPRRDGSAAVY